VSRSEELARLAIRRHEETGLALEESIARAICQAIEERAKSGGLWSPAEVSLSLGRTGKTTSTILARMAKRGMLKRARRGYYTVTDPDDRRWAIWPHVAAAFAIEAYQ
jgi:predicted transcriptional regulator of viral defense system